MSSLTKQLQDCIYSCSTCQQLCLETVRHCLKKGGEHAKPSHILLLLDCAEICNTNSNFISRGSNSIYQDTSALCAQVCSMSAVDCESIADNDPQMLKCVDACRKCAESCEQVAAETI